MRFASFLYLLGALLVFFQVTARVSPGKSETTQNKIQMSWLMTTCISAISYSYTWNVTWERKWERGEEREIKHVFVHVCACMHVYKYVNICVSLCGCTSMCLSVCARQRKRGTDSENKEEGVHATHTHTLTNPFWTQCHPQPPPAYLQVFPGNAADRSGTRRWRWSPGLWNTALPSPCPWLLTGRLQSPCIRPIPTTKDLKKLVCNNNYHMKCLHKQNCSGFANCLLSLDYFVIACSFYLSFIWICFLVCFMLISPVR